MTKQIALTAIFAVLATNAAFATNGVAVIAADAENANCYGDPINNQTSGTANLKAIWTNNVYDVSFDNNNVNATGSQTTAENCKYFDDNSATSADNCALGYHGDLREAGKIVSGWNTAANGSGTNVALADAPLANLPSASLGANGTTITLYAQWADCNYKYADNSTNDADHNVESVTAVATDNNTCKYTVTCAAGYNDVTPSAQTTTDGTTATMIVIPSDVCGTANTINLNWDNNSETATTTTPGSTTCDYGTTIQSVQQVTRPGYTFGGWEIAD